MSAEVHLAQAFLQAHPSRAARVLEQMPVMRAQAVLNEVSPELAAAALREMTASFAADCLSRLASSESGATILRAMPIDEASSVLRAMSEQARTKLLGSVEPADRDRMLRALSHLVGTAGAVMDPTVFHLPDDILVADARTRLTRAARDLLYYVYIVDRERFLVGVLDIPELMQARARDPLSVAMHRDVDRLNVLTPLATVRKHPGWEKYHALPVVDERDRLLGAVRYQTLRRLERDAGEGGPEPARVTAGALAELFQLGTSGFVAGLAASAAPDRDAERPMGQKSGGARGE